MRYVDTDSFKLGGWVRQQRKTKANNILTQERIKRLEALNGWTWDAITEQWEKGFEQLQCYVREYGNASIPLKYITSNGFRLGVWVSGQRKAKAKNIINKDNIARLEAINGWTWDVLKDQWEEGFKQLQYYIKVHSDTKVPLKHITPNGYNIGSWVAVQRRNKPKNLISQDRINRLEGIQGWFWSIKKESD